MGTESPLHVENLGAAVRRWPRHGSREFLPDEVFVVPDDQVAVFVARNQAADGLGGGEHLLTPTTVPRLTALSSHGRRSSPPLDAAVYFFPTDWRECRWGTRYPVAFRDNMFGVLRVRVCGGYRLRFVNPPLFVNSIVAPGEALGMFECEALIRDLISSRVADFLSERVDTVMDLPRYVGTAPSEIGCRLAEDFRSRGLELDAFSFHTVTMPDDSMLTLEARSGIGAVNEVVRFLRAQSVAAVRDEVEAPAPPADTPLGEEDTAGAPSPVPPESWGGRDVEGSELVDCPKCGNAVPGGSNACSYCAHPFFARHRCPACTAANPEGWRFCVECGDPNVSRWTCPSCATVIPVGSRFCMACGNPANAE